VGVGVQNTGANKRVELLVERREETGSKDEDIQHGNAPR